jgi:predicted metal-dependent peptidase
MKDDGPTTLDTGRLAAARLVASQLQPFLTLGLYALQPVVRPGLGTFAVDRQWRLYIDPARLARWTVPELAAVLLHEVGHVVRDHGGRAVAMGVGKDEARIWNLAADAEINDDLLRDGAQLPESAVVPSTFGLPPGRAAEFYFTILRDRRDLPPAPDCGSGCTGHDDAEDYESTLPAGLRAFEVDLLRRRIAQEVLRWAGSRPGVGSAGWSRWASAFLDPQLDWRTLLRSAVRQGVAALSGADDYSYRRPSRRRVPGVVLPSLVSPVPAIGVVIDTSGSMRDEDLDAAWSEVQSCLRSLGVHRDLVTIVAADVHAARVNSWSAKVELLGGGGTDLRTGIAAVMARRPRPGLLVVLTDGFTPWPERSPTARSIIVLLGDQGQVVTPPWATVVRVDTSQEAHPRGRLLGHPRAR